MSQLSAAFRSPAAIPSEPTAKLRGIPLIATWAALIAAPWAVIYGAMSLVL